MRRGRMVAFIEINDDSSDSLVTRREDWRAFAETSKVEREPTTRTSR